MSMGAGAIRAGLAVVELGMDLGPLDAGLNQAAAKLKGWAGKLAKIGAGVAGVGVSIAGPILAAFKGAVDQAAAMGTLATQIGTTAEEASRLAYALGTVGISEEEIVQFTRHLSGAFSSAADGSHEAVQSFARLGLNWQELAKMSPAEQMIAVKEAIGGIPNAFDRSTQAAQFFGRRGLEFAKLSADEIRKRMAEAGDVGAAVSPEQAAQAKEIQRAYGQMGAAIKFAFLEVGRALLPHVDTVREYSRAVVNVATTVREWVSGNKALVVGVLGLGVAITAAGVALVAVGVIGAAVGGVLSGVAAVAAVLFTKVALIIGVGLAGAAVQLALLGGAAYLFATRTDTGRAAVQRLLPVLGEIGAEGRKAWGVVRESAVEAWGGISSALKRGDLKTAWAIVVAELEVVWEQAKASFFAIWNPVRDKFIDGWQITVEFFRSVFADAIEALAPTFAPVITVIGKAMEMTMTLAKIVNGVITGIAQRVSALALRLSKTLVAKVHGQSGNLRQLGESLQDEGGAGEERWADKHVRKAREAVEEAKNARAAARDEDRAARDDAVKAARARLQAILDEEKKTAAAGAARPGGGGGGFGGGSLAQAAREVRGSFGVGISGSASAQQFFAQSSTPMQRQLVDIGKSQLDALNRIEKKVEGPPTWG